jgi:hypothetical protein
MKLEIGDIVRDTEGTNWVVIKRNAYQASAHNDRWTDYNTDFLKISKAGRITKQHARSGTDDILRGYVVVGKAKVTFTVDVENIKLEK